MALNSARCRFGYQSFTDGAQWCTCGSTRPESAGPTSQLRQLGHDAIGEKLEARIQDLAHWYSRRGAVEDACDREFFADLLQVLHDLLRAADEFILPVRLRRLIHLQVELRIAHLCPDLAVEAPSLDMEIGVPVPHHFRVLVCRGDGPGFNYLCLAFGVPSRLACGQVGVEEFWLGGCGGKIEAAAPGPLGSRGPGRPDPH